MSGGVINSRRIAKNTLFLYFRMIIAMGVSLVTTGVMMRVLGAVDFGINSVLGGVVAMFSFLNGSLSAAVSRNITFELGKGDKGRVGETFNVSLVVFLVLSLVVVLLCETIGLWFFHVKMQIPPERVRAAFWVLQVSILTCPLFLTQVPYQSVIVAHEDMGIYAYMSIADAVVKLLIVYLLFISPYDKLISLSLLGMAWGVISLLIYRVYCIRKYPETRLCLCRDKGLYKSIVGYAGSDLIGNLALLAQGQGLNLLLNTFFGPVVNAARGISYSVRGAAFKFCDNFQTAVRPQITKSYAVGDEKEMWRLIDWSTCAACYLLWVIALPLGLEADFVLKLWLGNYPEHTLVFLDLVLALCLIDVLQRPIVYVMHATGHILLYNVCTGSIMCCAFPLAYVFLKTGLPPVSVFVASLIVFIIGFGIEMFILRRYIRYSILHYLVHVVFRSLAVCGISFVLVFAAREMMPAQGFLRVILVSSCSVVSVAGLVFAGGLDRDIRSKIVSYAGKKLKGVL